MPLLRCAAAMVDSGAIIFGAQPKWGASLVERTAEMQRGGSAAGSELEKRGSEAWEGKPERGNSSG